MNDKNIIEITNGVARMPAYRLREPLNIKIRKGEPTAIFGDNASGKSMLVDLLTGAHPMLLTEPKYYFGETSDNKSGNIKVVTFCDAYGYGSDGFYQLRWNHGLMQESQTVRESLEQHASDGKLPQSIVENLNLSSLLDKKIIMLSSGELRRMQFAEALLHMPSLLIIDNPYIGLDENARRQTTDIMQNIIDTTDTTIIIVVSRLKDIPPFVRKVIYMRDMNISAYCDKSELCPDETTEDSLPKEIEGALLSLPHKEKTGGSIVECDNVNISYGSRHILRDFTWTVNEGEHWAINGENGAGKSTLLSLVCADNPQAYSQNITLFGFKRGSGESIWDIKKRIGYVSPELYRAYKKNTTVRRIVASGANDTGIIKSTADQGAMDSTSFWLRIFGIDGLAERNFLQISSGEQRLVLLARAFVKNPDLLILDEPFHGLDGNALRRARHIIDIYCRQENKTLLMVSHYKNEYPEIIDHELLLSNNTCCIYTKSDTRK